MNEQDNFDALFSPQVDMGETSSKPADDYQVGADKGQGGVYESIIRFIPWHKNPQKSISEKWVSWLVDPVTQKGRFVDCPSSIGKPSILQDMFWKLKKSESVQEQKKAEIFSRRHNFAALIQVIQDKNQPELEGKIMVYRFGKKLWEKLNAELKPILGEPHNPFDLLNGKAFHLKITKVSGFNNYDQSKFLDKIIPLCIIDEQKKLQPITATTDKAMVLNYLRENSPDLDKYGYKEWDQDIHDYVKGVITAVTGQAPPTNTMASINASIQKNNPTNETISTSSSGITSTEISLDDINTTGGIADAANSFPEIDLPDLPETSGDLGNLDDVLGSL